MWSLATNGRRPWVARSQQVLPDTTKQVGKQIAALSLRLLKKDRRRTLIPRLLGFREQVLSDGRGHVGL